MKAASPLWIFRPYMHIGAQKPKKAAAPAPLRLCHLILRVTHAKFNTRQQQHLPHWGVLSALPSSMKACLPFVAVFQHYTHIQNPCNQKGSRTSPTAAVSLLVSE